ncbi:MAG: DUF2889 domain-containing protein [Acidimicrobiales bacterium]
MLLLPEATGPHDPATATPPRTPGSVRRTSSIDTTRPDGLRAASVVEARARDLLTARDGQARVLGEAALHARVARSGELEEARARPAAPVDGLLGARVGAGFRGRLAEVLPGERARCTLLHLLLDDLPGATLVSGYALQRAGMLSGLGVRPGMVREDVCAGWAHEASLMTAVREHAEIPVPLGPSAPDLAGPGDPLAWHPMDDLPPHGMRRRRRLDLVAPADGGDGGWLVDAHFRDSYVDPEGRESVLHEYTVAGEVRPAAGVVVAMAARARVLPWTECPGAVASAGRLVGMALGDLRARVRQELVGRSTCTHLNDTLRAMADLPALAGALSAGLAPAAGG